MINKAGLDLIKHFESLHDGDSKEKGLQPKMDPIGIWTEGWGHVVRTPKGAIIRGSANKALAYKYSKIKTEEDADRVLAEDLNVYEVIVMRKISVPLTDNQISALTSHTYNTGGSETLFRLINQKAPKNDIYNWFVTKYITAGGVPLNGLKRRREAEAKLFFTP